MRPFLWLAVLGLATGGRIDDVAHAQVTSAGTVQYFGDWAVGCDNILHCQATGLQPDGGAPQAALLQIVREGGAAGALTLRAAGLDALPARLQIIVDGTRRSVTAVSGSEAVQTGAEALATVRAIATARTAELRERRAKAPFAAISTNGLAEALSFMDGRQGRRGTTTALVLPGKGSDARIPEPPAAPVIVHLPAPAADSAPPLTVDELARARGLALCDPGREAAGAPELFPLDGYAALILLTCDGGTDNDSAVPLIARGPAGGRTLSLAQFDREPGVSGAPGAPPLVVNALWDAPRGVLSSLAKGRPSGDCGASEDYVWDGSRFRLIEARAMQLCRGALEWIRLWKAQPMIAAHAP